MVVQAVIISSSIAIRIIVTTFVTCVDVSVIVVVGVRRRCQVCINYHVCIDVAEEPSQALRDCISFAL